MRTAAFNLPSLVKVKLLSLCLELFVNILLPFGGTKEVAPVYTVGSCFLG